MRILWISNTPTVPVGYATIVDNLLPEINKHFPSALQCNYGIEGYGKIDWWKLPIYSRGGSGFDEGMVINNARDFEADIIMPIMDIWAWGALHNLAFQNKIPYVPYVPIDSDETNMMFDEPLARSFRVIPMSEHSESAIRKKFDAKTYPYIPPGVDTKTFRPMWENDKEKAAFKAKLGFEEDAFVIGLMGDIKGYRKRWPENLEGIKIFMENNPDIKTRIYLHTLINGRGYEFNLNHLLGKFGLQNITRIVDQVKYLRGISYQEMAENYNGLDVFCHCSYGEGFGMMYTEAQACGTPVIGTDFTGVSKIIKAGYTVKPLFKPMDQSGARKAFPDPYDIADKLAKIANSDKYKWRKEGPEFTQQFEWSKIINERWLPALQKIEQEIEYNCFKPPEPSEWLKEKSGKLIQW